MKKLCWLICLLPNVLLAQTWQWVRQEGSGANDYVSSVCADDLGNCYVASLNGLSKYNSTGIQVWNVPTGSLAGATYVCYAGSRLYFVKDSAGYLIASQYDANGNLYWSTYCGNGPFCSITADNFGNLYLGAGGNVLSKLDTAGSILWMQTANAVGTSISTDRTGNIFVTGYFAGNTSFGVHQLTALGPTDIFVAKYSPAGNCIWVKRAGGNFSGSYSLDAGYGITADTTGNLYVTGSFVDTADFSPFTVSGLNGNEIFLAKYDTSGNVVWVQKAAGISDQEGRCISIDIQGNILIGGSYVPEVYFGSYQLNGWGNYDAFIAKYDPAGNFISEISAGEAGWNQFVRGICTDDLGNIYAVGEFSNTTYFGVDSLISTGLYDVFVAKIDFTTGIQENDDQSFIIVFPNPCSTGSVIFRFGADNEQTIIIFDQPGREIWRNENSGNQVKFSTEGVAAGVYFYRVEEKTGRTFSGKFVIY